MPSPLHTAWAWLQQLGGGITPQQTTVTVILSLITMTVVWLGQECSFLRRQVYQVRADVKKQAARLDRLQALVKDIGWRDSRLLTQFDWRPPPISGE